MFTIIPKEQVFDSFESRPQAIRSTDKLAVSDPDYLFFVSHFQSTELTPDICLFSYEQALNENRDLALHSPAIAETFWMIGTSGQGDGWFLHKQQHTIFFNDHEKGDDAQAPDFTSLNIGFTSFLQLGLLYRQLEQHLDDEAVAESILAAALSKEVNSLNAGLYDRYPFNYFNRL